MGSVEFALKEDERECEVIGSYASNCNVNFEGVRMRSGKMWHFSSVCFFLFLHVQYTPVHKQHVISRPYTLKCLWWRYGDTSTKAHCFLWITSIINQQMRYIKFHIKTLKIAPTCFDPKIILRELRCSLLKSFLKHLQNNSIILTGCCGSMSCCVRVRC